MRDKILKLTALLLSVVILAGCGAETDTDYESSIKEGSVSEECTEQPAEESSAAESSEESIADESSEESSEAEESELSEASEETEESEGTSEESAEFVPSEEESTADESQEEESCSFESRIEAEESEASTVPEETEESEDPTESIAVHVHEYISQVTAATCTEDGYTLYQCGCGDSYTADEAQAAGHSFGAWTTVTAPSCTERGEEESLCETCGERKTKSVSATGHSFGDWTVVREATTKTEGEEMRSCTLCGEYERRSTEKLVAATITPEDAEEICTLILELLNEERAKLGAPALSTAPIAHEMAMVRAEELTVVFSHKRPDGRDSSTIYREYMYNAEDLPNPKVDLEANPYYRCYMPEKSSEDICTGGALYTETPEEYAASIVNTFKGSSGHWADLTNPAYTAVGIGVVLKTNKSDWYYDGGVAILTMDKLYGSDTQYQN